MANLKDITTLPVAESADGLNLIVNDNGSAKQIAASAVGAQADWSVEDTTSPAYIMNKPSIPTKVSDLEKEWDLDLTIDIPWDVTNSTQSNPVFTAAEGYSYEAFTAKFEAGEIPKVKYQFNYSASETIMCVIRGKNVDVTQSLDSQTAPGYLIYIQTVDGIVPVGLLPDGTFIIA